MADKARKPSFFGKCTHCGIANHLASEVDHSGRLWHWCMTCYEFYFSKSLGDACQVCGYWDDLRGGYFEIQRSEERLMYSGILTEEEQYKYFGDSMHGLYACEECFHKLGMVDEPENLNLQSRPSDNVSIIFDNFSSRSLMSNIGVLMMKDIMQASGYEVRNSGFEENYRELKNKYVPEPNDSLLRQRSNPDLEVTDPETGLIYRIEVKTTTRTADNYQISVAEANKYRKYHGDAFLLIYHIPSASFWIQKIDAIEWDSLEIIEQGKEQFYGLNFLLLPRIEELFDKVTKDIVEQRKFLIKELFRQYFVGLEFEKQFSIDYTN